MKEWSVDFYRDEVAGCFVLDMRLFCKDHYINQISHIDYIPGYKDQSTLNEILILIQKSLNDIEKQRKDKKNG